MVKSKKSVAAGKEKKSSSKGVYFGRIVIIIAFIVLVGVLLETLINKNAPLSTSFELESFGVTIFALGITILFHGYAQEQAEKTEIILKDIKFILKDIKSELKK